ncbi:MAG TPA: hypothetical protein VKE70_13725 [Candidatus Solibacter sp.]|nr:hypothetical protein [Candidatus Solibacter sp.]
MALTYSGRLDCPDFRTPFQTELRQRRKRGINGNILHELAHFHKNCEAMQFLIDRGIDMTIADYRWGATAQGWALYAASDEKMAQWLGEAQQRRPQASR